MSPNQEKDRTVRIYRSSDIFAVDAIAEELRAAGITCSVEGRELAASFAGFTALDGVSMLSVVVLESDAARAREIASRWLNKWSSRQKADGA